MVNKNIIIIVIVVFLVLVALGIGIYFIIKNNSIKNNIDPKLYNISNYTEKSIWRVNTILKPGEERVSPNGLVKIYVKLENNPNKYDKQGIGLYCKNPNKIGKSGDLDVGDIPIFQVSIDSDSNIGITLTSSGTKPGGRFQIQTVTKNNITYFVTFVGDITKEDAQLNPLYFDENGIPQGKIRMDDNTKLSGFMLNTTDIDYILVRNDAILIFDKNNKLLSVF